MKNVPESIKSRLLNLSREKKRPFIEILQYYVIERFLFRLSISKYRNKFILKGALMLVYWGGINQRPTKDIDMLGITNHDVNSVINIIRDILGQEVEPDGVSFKLNTVTGEIINEEADYSGVRIRIGSKISTAKVNLQIDIGFDDIIFPKSQNIQFPTLLKGSNVPKMKGYSRESLIAEKFETIVKLNVFNSRMKDFWDIWFISSNFDFNKTYLAKAIQATFNKRNTKLSDSRSIFSKEFAENEQKEIQWRAFLNKNKMEIGPESFKGVVEQLKIFLSPIINSI
ncbi:nucleotidyl transferase AbiEii/AbiGii toxin family protein [Candidatus Margulisiibacteriota bacterium]